MELYFYCTVNQALSESADAAAAAAGLTRNRYADPKRTMCWLVKAWEAAEENEENTVLAAPGECHLHWP